MKCPKYGLFGLGGVEHQNVHAVRVSHFTVTVSKTPDRMPVGPWTRINWKCKRCGEVWTADKVGHWELSDFT